MPEAPQEGAQQETKEEGGVTWISIERVAESLDVKRPAVYYYIKKMNIRTKKFEFDRKAYIAIVDFERIQAAKKAALSGLR